jgi:aspartate/methionine/tyrosine aminotransferase
MDCTEELEANRAVYAANRRLMTEGLPRAGITDFAPPDGAFYVYADVSHLTGDSRAFCAEILAKTGVAITPGLDFDPLRGHRTVRFSYARATADVAEGLARLEAYLSRRG